MRSCNISILFCCAAVLASAQVEERPLVPVPFVPLELATGAVQTVDTPEKREAVATLVRRANQQLGLHGHKDSFDLKVSFTATGPWLNQGAGEMEEIWFSPAEWRWTAHVGAYSQTRIGSEPELAYDEQPASQDMFPFPLQMIRDAIFTPLVGNPNRDSLGTVSSSLNGAAVACVLSTSPSNPISKAPGRFWPEREYCISPESGLLQIGSLAPGSYVAYDYTNAFHFHEQVIPGRIAISENGRTVLEARIESITDPGPLAPTLFKPTPEMLARGPSPAMAAPERFSRVLPAAKYDPSGLIQPTIVHALIDQTGNVREAVALQSTNVSAAALDFVKRSKFPQATATGTAPIQREAFINVQFEPAAPPPAPLRIKAVAPGDPPPPRVVVR